MNFATLKGLTIPEGNVTKITDASGNVLWSAAKPVTITLKRHQNYSGTVVHGWIEINGVPYYAAETPTEITVTEGTKILCCATSQVQLNGTTVAQWNGTEVRYEYTASVNATIEVMNAHNSDTQYLSIILITEQ
jgi:hypothetical protein